MGICNPTFPSYTGISSSPGRTSLNLLKNWNGQSRGIQRLKHYLLAKINDINVFFIFTLLGSHRSVTNTDILGTGASVADLSAMDQRAINDELGTSNGNDISQCMPPFEWADSVSRLPSDRQTAACLKRKPVCRTCTETTCKHEYHMDVTYIPEKSPNAKDKQIVMSY